CNVTIHNRCKDSLPNCTKVKQKTLLGSRRGRPTLSLSKSVSTTNIAGTFNDESPLGIRRILSQSTDSLNMRNRTLSVESLIDEAELAFVQLRIQVLLDEEGKCRARVSLWLFPEIWSVFPR
ncbi:hypothetical protein E2320_013773, partial [Naja naja]